MLELRWVFVFLLQGFENHLKESEKQVAASKSQLAEVTSRLNTLQAEHNQKLQELANVAKQNEVRTKKFSY